MSGEEIIEILKEQLGELAESLSEGAESAYEELQEIIDEAGYEKDEMKNMLREVLVLMKDAGRITEEAYKDIIEQIEGL